MTSATDRDGRRRDFSYDNDNRKTGESWVISGNVVNVSTFSYDPNSNLLTAASAAGAYTMSYDRSRRISSEKKSIDIETPVMCPPVPPLCTSDMKFHFLELPLSLIHEDPRYPDGDTRHIYEHLKHSLSRPSLFPLPAIDVSLVDKQFVVTRGHMYLRIARDLGRPWISSVFSSDVREPADLLKVLPPGIRVTPRDELEREAAIKVSRGYHVYFFEHPLGPDAQKRFIADIAGYFERLDSPWIEKSEKRLLQWRFPFGALCAEFEAIIPIGDPSWIGPYLSICRIFSRDVQRIVSFQGARFPE